MTLSIGPATDYLYGLAQTAVTGVTVNGKPMVAVDGVPDKLEFGMFVVGISDAPPNTIGETQGSRAQLTAEVGLSADNYLIPCYIEVRVPGVVQKTARDLASGVFNTFWTAFVADLTLGGALKNSSAELTEITATPSNTGTAAEPGRKQRLAFGVTCVGFSD